MWMKFLWFVVAAIVVGCKSQKLGARINTKGVRGVAYVYKGLTPNSVFISLDVTGLKNPNGLEVRVSRTLRNVEQRCLDRNLSKRVLVVQGVVLPTKSRHVFQVAGKVENFQGRSILLVDKVTGERVCGTIEYFTPYTTAEAKFLLNVGGKVVFRQQRINAHSYTSMYSNLFKTSQLHPRPKRMIWQVVKGRTSLDDRHCKRLRRHRPFAHGRVNVGARKDDYVDTVNIASLPLDKAGSIIGKFLLLRMPNGRVMSCALIRKVVPKSAVASFFSEGVKGSIGFYQESEYDITHAVIRLNNLRQIASGFHVHKWPVPLKLTADESVCSPSKVSGHYNPFNVDIKQSPPPGVGTEDQYELGDLSGKYGTLEGRDNYVKTASDDNLPLFGKYSVIGRSIVIHRKDKSRWICATIVPQFDLIRAVAIFKTPVIGRIVMTQDRNDRFADTQIYVELNYANGLTAPTQDHNWHVHVNNVCSDFNDKPCACSEAGGHYNPHSVELKGDYSTECRVTNPFRCEMGDQSGKHGKIDIRASNGDFSRFFFTDEHLQLTGIFGIIGKSIVIHDANSGKGRLACANIDPSPQRQLKVDKWFTMSSSRATGYFQFIGGIEKFQEEQTITKINMRNLDQQADGFHVHQFPVPGPLSKPCSPGAVGGHFNPFNVDIKQSPPAGSGTHDEYEVGDLSGKYGKLLTGRNNVIVDGIDNFLPVRGPLSIAGRSIVIHKPGGSRWVCGTIEENLLRTRGTVVRARASFSTGPVRGFILLWQYRYPDGRLSDTSILLNLQPAPGQQNSNCHNWHVHVNSLPSGEAVSDGCSSAGPHYNPFNVNVKQGYDECKFENPWRCELGDSSGKHGCYDIGGGKRFYTDVNLPLAGRYGVIGRSFVVHVANKGAPRYVCANIKAI